MIDKHSFLGNTTADPRLLGTGTLLVPWAQNTSGQRLAMEHNHLPQAQIPAQPEPPEIATGFEQLVGDYEICPSARSEDIQIMSVIPKFIPGQLSTTSRVNPRTTVIYQGNDTGEVSYFHLDTYTRGTDGYGYKNKLLSARYLSEGNYVPKGIKFQTSPAHVGERYSLGVNLETAMFTHSDVSDDAFAISVSAAKRMTPLAVCTRIINPRSTQIPLNLYGDDQEYRFMPDVGERIRDDGIILGFREPDAVSYVTDLMSSSLSQPQSMHDELYRANGADAIITDISVYVNSHQQLNPVIYAQLYKYREAMVRYWTRIVEAYNTAKSKNWPISRKFNTLVFKAMAMLMSENRPVPGSNKRFDIKPVLKKDEIECLTLVITYVYQSNVAPGFKFTDRNGSKGVALKVVPDEDMPVDDYGRRADLAMDILSVPNRMNPGQLYECFTTRTDWFMVQRVKHMVAGGDIHQPFPYKPEDPNSALIPPVSDEVKATTPFELVIEFITDLNPNYGKLLADTLNTPQGQQMLVQGVIDEGFWVIIPPFLDNISEDWVLYLDKKYPAPATSVEYAVYRRDGTRRIARTIDPVLIGKKYCYVLYRMPKVKASGPGYVNQHQTPIHPNAHARLLYPIHQTPLRVGEDEIRNFIMALGSMLAARIMGLYANSSRGLSMMMDDLLSMDYPTQLERVDISTRELIESNSIIKLAHHLFSTVGVRIDVSVGPGDPRYDNFMRWLSGEGGVVMEESTELPDEDMTVLSDLILTDSKEDQERLEETSLAEAKSHHKRIKQLIEDEVEACSSDKTNNDSGDDCD